MKSFKQLLSESGKKAFRRNLNRLYTYNAFQEPLNRHLRDLTSQSELASQQRSDLHLFRAARSTGLIPSYYKNDPKGKEEFEKILRLDSSKLSDRQQNLKSEIKKAEEVRVARKSKAVENFKTSVPRMTAKYIQGHFFPHDRPITPPPAELMANYPVDILRYQENVRQENVLGRIIANEIPRDVPKWQSGELNDGDPIHRWHPTAQKIYSRVRHLVGNGTLQSNDPHNTALGYAKVVDLRSGSLDPARPGVAEKMLRIVGIGDKKLTGILQKHIESQDVQESLTYSFSDFLIEKTTQDVISTIRSMVDSHPIHFADLGDKSKQEISAGQALSRFHSYRILTANAKHENLGEQKLARVKNLIHDQILGSKSLMGRIGSLPHFSGKNRNSVRSAVGHVLSSYESEAPQRLMNDFKENPQSVSIQPIRPETNINQHMLEYIKR
jgi:hypothetical protein